MPASVAEMNQAFIDNALERNYAMPNYPITTQGQLIDIEMDSVPGWAAAIDLACYFNINLAYSVAPSLSQFAPYNFFSEIQVSLGGGPFQRVSPYFNYLREAAMSEGWFPDMSAKSFSYAAASVYNVPAIAAGDTYYAFNVRIPLQSMFGSVYGLIPMGSASTKVKIRLTVSPLLYGADQWLNSFYGGTVTGCTIGTAQTSYVSPNIVYLTTPAVRQNVPEPKVGFVLNVQQKVTPFTGAGSLTPITFKDPFTYLRLWHVVINGAGAPDTADVTNFELDLTPGYPQYNYNSPSSMRQYFYNIRRKYKTDMPTGVFVFDLWAGSDPENPNGTQMIDASVFQTLQTQLQVSGSTNVASPAKIITFAEALSPVGF